MDLEDEGLYKCEVTYLLIIIIHRFHYYYYSGDLPGPPVAAVSRGAAVEADHLCPALQPGDPPEASPGSGHSRGHSWLHTRRQSGLHHLPRLSGAIIFLNVLFSYEDAALEALISVCRQS